MAVSETEEIIPLIDHKSDVGRFQYNSLYQSQVQKSSSQKNKDDNNGLKRGGICTSADIWDQTTRTPSSLLYPEDARDQNITYRWSNLDVCERPKVSTWKKLCGVIGRTKLQREQRRHILKKVYGVAYPGEFLAILGSSGSGKTTLLNALTFQSCHTVKGTRCLNDIPVNDRNTIVRLSAYVEQENLFFEKLTVKEHLIFQSLIRISSNVPYRQKLKRVQDVMSELGLEKCQNAIIGHPGRNNGISGGEMKRLSFASEILTNPPIMFCDEPTSGLDSFMALNVINVLKSMAVRGKTVICTIHQPSSEIFSVFDKILLLAEGRTAFIGDPKEAISFFSELGASPPLHYNPADFFIQLLAVAPYREESCKNNIKLICDSFEQSLQGLKFATPVESNTHNQVFLENIKWNKEAGLYSATWCRQFKALFWRSWINVIKEPILVKVRLFQIVVLSLVVGLIYHQQNLNEDGVMNINGVLFTFLTTMTFQNLFAVITVFSSELPLFLKENSNKLYRVDAYFLSKTLAEIPMFLTVPVIFTSVTYYWINLNAKFVHFTFAVLILILVTNVATSFGYFLSCISTNVVMALSVGPPVVIPFLLFGGFLLNSGAVPEYFKWLSYLSWFKYGNEALLINQWSGIENIECKTSNVTCPRTGEIVLEIYHFQKENFVWDLISLLMLIILFRVLAFLALLFKVYRYQRF